MTSRNLRRVHDVIGLYWTGLGGVQSKCCRQSYGADELCGGTVIEECLLEMLVEVDCNRGLQSHSYPFHSLRIIPCNQQMLAADVRFVKKWLA